MIVCLLLFHKWCDFVLIDIITRRYELWLKWKGFGLRVKVCSVSMVPKESLPPTSLQDELPSDSGRFIFSIWWWKVKWFSVLGPWASLRNWILSVQTHKLTTKNNLGWPHDQFEDRSICITVISIWRQMKEKQRQMEGFLLNHALGPHHFIHSQESAERCTWRFPTLTQIVFWLKSYGY